MERGTPAKILSDNEKTSFIPTTNKIACNQTVIPLLNDISGAQNLKRENNSFKPSFPLRNKEVRIAEIDAVTGHANKTRTNHNPPDTFRAIGKE